MAGSPDSLDLRVDRDADLPVGAQLARMIRELIDGGALRPGGRLPSVRELALEAGVNVNTARAVYGRLENEGVVRSEQGRGTFVARRDAPRRTPKEEAAARRELRAQIAELEAELVSRRPVAHPEEPAPARRRGGRLPTADELAAIRDDLLARLRELDDQRAEVLRRLADLDEPSAERAERRSSASLPGARVRWLGA